MSQDAARPRRQLSVALAGVLALLFALAVPAAPAGAEQPQARGIDRVCPAPALPGVTVPTFPDLGTTHAESIRCAAGYSTVSGFVDGTFRPNQPITRGQMATFVAQWLRTATGIPLAVPDEQPFTDVEGNVHARAIAALAAAEIIGGRPDGTFGPQETLTRGQFTRSVANAISYADVFAVGGPLPPAGGRVTFTDVEGTTFEETILALADVGVALGTVGGEFQPAAAVTRGQLATFLMRSADYLDRHQRWRPTARTVVLLANLELVAGTAPTPPPGAEPGDPLPPQAVAALTVNAFNGTLGYTLEVTGAPGPYRDPGATLHVGTPAAGGPQVLLLAGVEELAEAETGLVTGVVEEADSTVRFADLIEDPQGVFVQLVTEAGVLRGTLRPLTP